MEKFVVVPKEDKAVTMTIRIDRALQEKYNELSAKTNRSRNELIAWLCNMHLITWRLRTRSKAKTRAVGFCPLALDCFIAMLAYVYCSSGNHSACWRLLYSVPQTNEHIYPLL